MYFTKKQNNAAIFYRVKEEKDDIRFKINIRHEVSLRKVNIREKDCSLLCNLKRVFVNIKVCFHSEEFETKTCDYRVSC